MDQQSDNRSKVVPNIILLVAIFVLLHLANITEVLSYLSRPLVTSAAKLLGIAAYNRGNDIVLGKLILPWTQDCSGINTLIMLWGITLWANRQQPIRPVLFLRLVLCVPAALIANLLRIATLALYRFVFYPSWESQQLHYLIGFLWLLPFLALFVTDFRQKSRSDWMEILYMAVILALLAPVVFSPGGSVVTVCTLFFLAHNCPSDREFKTIWWAYLVWGFLALLIGWSRMESLWIPWLLVCPRFVAVRILFSFSGLILLAGTVSLFAMRTAGQVAVVAALLYEAYRLVRKITAPARVMTAPALGLPEIALLTALMLAPFMLPGTIGIRYELEQPPPGIMAKQLSFNSYRLRVSGQPSDIAMYWYGAYGDGRHHALPACMRFRGVILKTTAGTPSVYSGDGRWMREFFIHNHALKLSYAEYLLASFSPFASPGVHVIFEAPETAMSSDYFAQESLLLVKHLHQLYSAGKLSSPGGDLREGLPPAG